MTSNRYYQQGASNFASFFGNSKRLELLKHLIPEMVILEKGLQRPLNILDVGAGTGMHAHFVASQMGHKVTAVEPVGEMIEKGKELYTHTNLEFVEDSLPDLKKIDCQFDVIYSVAAWQYIKPEDRQTAMSRLAELLSPGGVFAIIWPIPMSREF